jgi:hypothetical protein
MSNFEPENVKRQLLSETGVEYFLARSLDDAAASRALTRGADMRIVEGVRCVLVDFNDEARELLYKAKEWLEHAIATEEKPRHYFRYGTEAGRHENLALCNWLLSDLDDHENLNAAVSFGALYNADNPPNKEAVAIELPVYIDARCYDEALALYERHWGAKKPTGLKSIKGEAAMSYVIAAAHVRREYSDEEVSSAIDGFLRHKVPDFLEHGGYPYLARWLKIAHWSDNPQRLSAFETVRRCYDYLPNVARPNTA